MCIRDSGITAIQMDLKVDGLTPAIVKEALEKTHKARNYIIDEIILKCIPAPREELSKYAPKMLSTVIPVDKIREVIGSGGKVIQKICAESVSYTHLDVYKRQAPGFSMRFAPFWGTSGSTGWMNPLK